MQKRAEKLQKFLDKEFPLKPNEVKTDLYYLKKYKYTLLIAILLSANTSDKQVNKITPTLFKLANTPNKMLKLGKSKIRNIIKPIGLAEKKSTYIINLSKTLIKDYNNKVPNDKKELIKLPGVGNKIAGVFLINSGGSADLPVDTHVKKCAIKWRLTKETNPTKISEDLKKLFPKRKWVKIRYQMINASRAKMC